MQDGNMFNVNLLHEFYKFEDNADFDVSEEVKIAYYIFIKDYCPMVSSHWKTYMYKRCKQRETATFLNQLTRSDEAFTFWLIQCLEPKAILDHKFILEHGMNSWKRKRGRGGKHDSNVKFEEFIKTYNKIDMLRNNQKGYNFWMNIFFDQFFQNFGKKKESIKTGESSKSTETAVTRVVDIQQSFD